MNKIHLTAFILIFCTKTLIIGANTVYKYPNMASGSPLSDLRQTTAPKNKPIRSYKIKLHHASLDETQTIISNLYPDLPFSISPRTHTLLFKSTKETYRDIYRTIKKMDHGQSLISIEVSIIETSAFESEQYQSLLSQIGQGLYGIYDLNTGSLNSNSGIPVSLQQLMTEGKANLLATPRITVLDNHTSTIHVGDRLPYVNSYLSNDRLYSDVQYADTGIALSIHPKITVDDQMDIDINASISTVKLWKDFANTKYPILSTRKTNTKVSIKNGQTLILAGLIDATEKTNTTSIPLLSMIPFIGKLFQSESLEKGKSDILFIIKPQIGVERKKALE